MKEFEIKIKEALALFQEGYKNRDLNILDSYIETLFEDHKKTAILGTSGGEWMKGKEGAREIVESDWKYWGDVAIDIEGAAIEVLGETAYVSMKGTVKYVFEHTEEKYESYLNFVKNFFDASTLDYRMSPKAKAGTMGFVLTHFNQNRTEGKREYFYPLRINTVMTMKENRAVFRFMEFSVDYHGRYPELRIDNQMMNMNHYYREQKDMAEALRAEQRPEIKAIIDSAVGFLQQGFNKGAQANDLSGYFSGTQDIRLVDTKGSCHKGQAVIDYILSQRATWKNIAVDDNAVFVDYEKETAWLVCNAVASNTIDENAAGERLMEYIQNTIDCDLTAKDKLFVVQREISAYFMQHAKGDQFLWPLRIAAVLQKEEQQWKLHDMSISYPFHYVLEGKYTGADMI